MKIALYILAGMIVSYLLVFLGNLGLVLLGGATFGILVYIAVNISKKNGNQNN